MTSNDNLRKTRHSKAVDHPQSSARLPLPVQLTSFIGREQELAEIKELLTLSRLVTFTGAGGCGKTRLALHVASELQDSYANGVCWVDLAPLTDPKLLPQTIAKSLNIAELPGRPILDLVLEFVHDKQLLLVLDNCEHLALACAEIAHNLLCDAPLIQILATSREPLAVRGERLYPVPPLSLPPKSEQMDIDRFDSIRLFIERAQGVLPEFKLTTKNTQTVVDICHRLDGIPLAIELASARLNVLSVEQIATRLDDRFALLTSESYGVPSYHLTLQATLDWSYKLLSKRERILFQRFSVFAGGCTLDAIEHVCSGDDAVPEQIFTDISSLVNKSLIVTDTLERREARYKMLETIRQYAYKKLCDSSESKEVRNRHLDYFLNYAQSADRKLHTAEELEWLDLLDQEHDNLRAALGWSLSEGFVEKYASLIAALMGFWEIRAYWREGRERAEALLVEPQASSRNLNRMIGLLAAGITCSRWNIGDENASSQYLNELVGIARELGDSSKRHLALGLCYLSESIFNENPVLADAMVEESLSIARSLGELWIAASVLRLKAFAFRPGRKYSEIHKCYEESLAICQSIGDKRGTAHSLLGLGMILPYEGDYENARGYLNHSLSCYRELRDRVGIAAVLLVLGEVERADHHYGKAKEYYLQCLDIYREVGSEISVKLTLANLGFICLAEGKPDSAKTLLAESYVLGKHAKSFIPWEILLGFAAMMSVQKNPKRAVRLFSVFQSFIETGDVRTMSKADFIDYERYLTVARSQLDPVSFDSAWEEGKQISIDQAIEEVEREILTPPALSTQPELSHNVNALTPREIEVLRLVAAGLSDSQVAEKLVISRRTVSTHLSAIYGKLGVSSRTAATRFALDHDLI